MSRRAISKATRNVISSPVSADGVAHSDLRNGKIRGVCVWTGSCPCQPFSQAGKGKGVKDERHLWPVFSGLIRKCRPPIVIGEQVASEPGLAWLDLVLPDLEDAGYASGAVDLCAAGVKAPHVRQRLWFVGIANRHGRAARGQAGTPLGQGRAIVATGGARKLGNPGGAGLARPSRQRANHAQEFPSTQRASGWPRLAWLPCLDGVQRPTQPGLFPVAYGLPRDVGQVRGYGNAIVPHVAAEVIKAVMATI